MSFSLKGWKTIALNAIVLITALLELFSHFDLLTGGILGLSTTGVTIIAVLSGANLLLRWFTTTPIFDSESKDAKELKTKLETVLVSGGDVVEAVKEVVGPAAPAV